MPDAEPADHDRLVERVGAARHEAWSRIGRIDDDVLTHLINPSFLGGPTWPAFRQGFVRVELPDGTGLLASDGLSDPFEGDPNPGLGAEVYAVSAELAGVDLTDVKTHWTFELVYQVAQNLVDQRVDLVEMLERYGALSMEVPGVEAPAGWADDGAVGLLIGIPSPSVPGAIELPTGVIALVGVAALRSDELRAIVEGGAEVRRRIAERLSALDPRELASRHRASVAGD